MRIALLNPPTTLDDRMMYLEPLGLAYIAGACRAAGHEVVLEDLVHPRHLDWPRLFARLDGFRPELVGITAMTESFTGGLALARAVKARYGVPVIFGGWHVSGTPEEVLRPELDFVVRGEGEETVLELLAHLEGGRPALGDIAGLVWVDGGEMRVNAPRARIKSLARLAEPVRDGLPLSEYRFALLFSHPLSRMRARSLQASRGCPYTCSFCQTPPIWGSAWTRRRPVEVVDELERLVDDHGANVVWMRDEEFNVNPRWVIEICEEIVRRDLPRRLSWGSFCRPDEATEELVAALAAAGYCYAFVGIENGDPESRTRFSKTYAQEEAERTLWLFDLHDVTTHCGYIIGWPWETRESIETGFRWIQSLPADFVSFGFATPFGGTALRAELEAAGVDMVRDSDRYTARDPVVPIPAMGLDELEALGKELTRRFFFRRAYVARLARRIARRPVRAWVVAELVAQALWHRLRYGVPAGRRWEVPERYLVPVEDGLQAKHRKIAPLVEG